MKIGSRSVGHIIPGTLLAAFVIAAIPIATVHAAADKGLLANFQGKAKTSGCAATKKLCTISFAGTGMVVPIGPSSENGSLQGPLCGGTDSGTATITSAGAGPAKNSITAALKGKVCLANGVLQFSVKYLIMGGTGLYKNAMGNGTVNGVISLTGPTGGPYKDQWQGTFTY